MLPELQGRLPIRVELELTEDDFVRILSETRANLVEQYRALLDTEKVTLDFSSEAIAEICKNCSASKRVLKYWCTSTPNGNGTPFGGD